MTFKQCHIPQLEPLSQLQRMSACSTTTGLFPVGCTGMGEAQLQPGSQNGSRRSLQAARPPCFPAEGYLYPKPLPSSSGLPNKVPKTKRNQLPLPRALIRSWPGMNPAAAVRFLLGKEKGITGRSSSFQALCDEVAVPPYTSDVLTILSCSLSPNSHTAHWSFKVCEWDNLGTIPFGLSEFQLFFGGVGGVGGWSLFQKPCAEKCYCDGLVWHWTPVCAQSAQDRKGTYYTSKTQGLGLHSSSGS